MNPDYDPSNAVEMRVTPPDGSGGSDTAGTYLADLRWYVHNLRTEDDESRFERMQWPYIHKYLGHDLYIGLADNPGFQVPAVTLKPGEHREIGPYGILYTKPIVQPGQYIAARVFLRTPDGKILQAQPGMKFLPPEDGSSMPRRVDVDVSIPDAPDANGVPGAIYLQRLDAATQSATLLVNLPGYNGVWDVPIEVTFKPWINLVWLGVAITGLGTLLAMVRRWRELDGIAVDADVDEALGRQQTDAAKAVPPGAAPRKRPVPAHTTR